MENLQQSMQLMAQHLRKPEGETGIEVASFMAQSNATLYNELFKMVKNQSGFVLEIGPADGVFTKMLFEQTKINHYTGVDYSQTMIDEARKNNHELIATGKADFICSDFMDYQSEKMYDLIFTINTVYFWKDVTAGLKHLKSLLSEKGTLILVYRDASTMQNLPFTKYGFTLFEAEEIERSLVKSGFSGIKTENIPSEVTAVTGEQMTFNNLFTIARNG